MKIAFVTSYDAGGTWNVAQPLAKALRQEGHTVNLTAIGRGHEASRRAFISGDYDLVHFWNLEEARAFIEIGQPIVVTINSLHPITASRYLPFLRDLAPARIHTHDPWMVRFLGQHDFTNVTRIPQAFDHSLWPVLPLPKEFAVGYVGDGTLKRFDVIEAATQLARVPCYGLSCDPWKSQAEVLDHYRKISCYVVASFNDSGPLPPQEALLCGRPIVTTPVGMMSEIVMEKSNGLFHDGSVEDCAKKILQVKQTLDLFTPMEQWLPMIEDVVFDYLYLYEEALEG